MAQTIQGAVNQYLGKDFDSFDEMIKDLTASPSHYIKNKINAEKISKDKLKNFIEGNTLFSNDSYFVSYSPSSVSLDSGLKKTTLWNNVIGEKDSLLSPEEFKAKAQYMALMSHNIGKRDLDLEAVEYFFGEHINLRALNQRNRINNSRFENDKEFERMIVEHFILESPGNIEKNLELLDRKTSKNIESYVNYYLKGINEENYRSKLSSSNINYSGDYYDLISNISGSVYQSDNLNEILKERQNTLNEKKERIKSEEEKFINKGLRKLDSSEDSFKEFIKTSNMNEIDALSVRKLRDLGFDGEDEEVDFEKIQAIKAECKKYNDNLDCRNAGTVINGVEKKSSENKKVSSFNVKNK